MSTHKSGFQSFSVFLHHFVLAKLAASSRRVNYRICEALAHDYIYTWKDCKIYTKMFPQ